MGKSNRQGGKRKVNHDQRRHRDEKFDVENCSSRMASCQIGGYIGNVVLGPCHLMICTYTLIISSLLNKYYSGRTVIMSSLYGVLHKQTCIVMDLLISETSPADHKCYTIIYMSLLWG